MLNKKELYALKHIAKYCEQLGEIKQRAENSFDIFSNDKILQLSAGMCIIQIGELSTHLTEQTKNKLSSIPWKSIKDMRNIFAHRYGTIDIAETWNTIENRIPSLLAACSAEIETNFAYAEINQNQLETLKKEKVQFSIKKKNNKICIRYYKFDEEKINNILKSSPPQYKPKL